MSEILDNFDNSSESEIQEKDIFIQIWMKPRAVFRYIINHDYDKYLTILLILAGTASGFDYVQEYSIVDSASLLEILAKPLILGTLLGWISYYIYAALLSWTGSWLDGKANTRTILIVLAYAALPTIIGLIPIFVQIRLWGGSLFREDFIDLIDVFPGDIIYWIIIVFQFVLLIWSIVLNVIGISEAQNFTIARAIANLLLPILLLIVTMLPLFFVYLFFKEMNSGIESFF